MQNSKLAKYGLVSALLASGYVTLVTTFINNAQRIFGKTPNVWSATLFLLIFVFSATLMGVIVFGRPVILYLEGLKKEALKLIFFTLTFQFTILLILVVALLAGNRG